MNMLPVGRPGGGYTPLNNNEQTQAQSKKQVGPHAWISSAVIAELTTKFTSIGPPSAENQVPTAVKGRESAISEESKPAISEQSKLDKNSVNNSKEKFSAQFKELLEKVYAFAKEKLGQVGETFKDFGQKVGKSFNEKTANTQLPKQAKTDVANKAKEVSTPKPGLSAEDKTKNLSLVCQHMKDLIQREGTGGLIRVSGSLTTANNLRNIVNTKVLSHADLKKMECSLNDWSSFIKKELDEYKLLPQDTSAKENKNETLEAVEAEIANRPPEEQKQIKICMDFFAELYHEAPETTKENQDLPLLRKDNMTKVLGPTFCSREAPGFTPTMESVGAITKGQQQEAQRLLEGWHQKYPNGA